MSGPITSLEELASVLAAHESAARSVATETQKETLRDKLSALADDLAHEREALTALIESLRRHLDDPDHMERLTDHGDRNDPESDLGL